MWPREREGHTGGRGGPHKGGGQPAGSLGCSRSHLYEVSQRNAGTELREDFGMPIQDSNAEE